MSMKSTNFFCTQFTTFSDILFFFFFYLSLFLIIYLSFTLRCALLYVVSLQVQRFKCFVLFCFVVVPFYTMCVHMVWTKIYSTFSLNFLSFFRINVSISSIHFSLTHNEIQRRQSHTHTQTHRLVSPRIWLTTTIFVSGNAMRRQHSPYIKRG